MKVKATRMGYYNHRRRRENDEFELMNEKQFSKKWMVKLDGEVPKAAPVQKQEQAPVLTSSEEVI